MFRSSATEAGWSVNKTTQTGKQSLRISRKQLSVNLCAHVHGYMMRLKIWFNEEGKLNLKTRWHSKKRGEEWDVHKKGKRTPIPRHFSVHFEWFRGPRARLGPWTMLEVTVLCQSCCWTELRAVQWCPVSIFMWTAEDAHYFFLF